jgi:extracellular serine/threonine protein kinase FAM20C
VLGFFRVPPTVGRLFNISADLWQKADTELAKTFFFSPAGNTCFSGHCSYYCDTTHAICGKPGDKLEGSVQLLLPSKPLVDWKATTHPYRRSYNRKRKADWEINQNYCTENVFTDDLFQSKLLLDLMDMAVFDFLTGNMDRHHFERMISLSNKTFSLHLGNFCCCCCCIKQNKYVNFYNLI